MILCRPPTLQSCVGVGFGGCGFWCFAVGALSSLFARPSHPSRASPGGPRTPFDCPCRLSGEVRAISPYFLYMSSVRVRLLSTTEALGSGNTRHALINMYTCHFGSRALFVCALESSGYRVSCFFAAFLVSAPPIENAADGRRC